MQQVNTAQELVNGVIDLVSLPEVCLRINELIDDDRATADEFGEVISMDTGLTARLLKIVNSPVYGYSQRVDTISRAVSILGLQELRALVIAASAVDAFTSLSTSQLNKVRFWRHSLYTGVIARLLARQCNVLHSERLFVAGMLHDIGKMLLSYRLPEQMSRVHTMSSVTGQDEDDMEKQMLGYTHAEAGAELLRKWNLPAVLCDTVAYHHKPFASPHGQFEACLIHIANLVAAQGEYGINIEETHELDKIDPEAWKLVGLNPGIYKSLVMMATPIFIEAIDIILPHNYQKS